MNTEKMEKLARSLIAKGHLLEAGWESYRKGVYSGEDAFQSAAEMDELRNAFYAGCLHLFSGMIVAATNKDGIPAATLNGISDELTRHGQELMQRVAAESRKH